MELDDARQKLIAEGLKGYLPVVSAVTAFKKEIQTAARSVLLASIARIRQEAGCDVKDPPVEAPFEGVEEEALVLGHNLQTSATGSDPNLRWSGIYTGIAWIRDNQGNLVPVVCCELWLEGGGPRDNLFTSFSAHPDALSDGTKLRKLAQRSSVQVYRPIVPERDIAQQLQGVLDDMIALLGASGGLTQGVLKR